MSDVQRVYQRCYAQLQSAFDAIPNTGGTATLAGSDCCLIASLATDASQAEIERPDKSGTLDDVPAQGGRRIASATLTMSMAGNGAAGVAPDCKNFLQGGFGKAPTIVAGTSVTWGLDDTVFYLSVWHFNAPTGATQMVLFNGVVTKLEVTFGGDVPMLSITIEGGWVYDSDQAADVTTPALAKGGLTAFPAEPATPVFNGTHPKGFEVTATIDGTAYTTLLSGTITLEVARELRKDTNSEFARQGASGKRRVTVAWSMADDDSGTMRTLKQKAMKRTAINASFAIGSVPGNIWTWSATGIVPAKPKYGDAGIRRKVDFAASRAYPSALNAKDQLTLAIT